MTDKQVQIPRSVLYGLLTVLVGLVIGALVTVFAGLPQAIADVQSATKVNREAIEVLRTHLHEIQEEQREQRRILVDIAARIGK